MSIMKAILETAAGLSGVTEEELDTWRQQARQQTGDDDVRLIRERQLASWTGSSTPISQQITNSEQHLDNLLEAAMPMIRALLPRLFAIEHKQYRIDRLKEEHAAQRASSLTNAAGGLHEDYIALAKLLQRLGAGPSKVRQWAMEDLVIIADLARHKAADPLYADPDNPWIAVRAVYANRTIEKVGKNDKAEAKSVPGAPPPDGKWISSKKYWRFGAGTAVTQTIAAPVGGRENDPPVAVVEPIEPPGVAEGGISAIRAPVSAAAVTLDDRPDLIASRKAAAASLAAGQARFQATGQQWYKPEASQQVPDVVALPQPQPDSSTMSAPGSNEVIRADPPASIPAPAPMVAPRPRRTIDAEQAREIAPRYVEMERSWISGFWPSSVSTDERSRDVLLPALEAEFGSFRNAEPFASWFRAVEADRAIEFIDERRDNEIANVIQMLMRGHSMIVGRAERFGLLSAEDDEGLPR